GSVAPVKLITLEPAVAVTVPPPVEPPTRPLGVATTNPEGNVSVKLTPVTGVSAFGFPTVNARSVVAPTPIKAAPNFVMIAGGKTIGTTRSSSWNKHGRKR